MRRAPLRKILERLVGAPDAYSRQKVRLECGHEIWCSAAAIYRARCILCAGDLNRAERAIVHENGPYWVRDTGKLYQVMRPHGAVASESEPTGYARTEDGKSLAIARCDYLANRQTVATRDVS